VRDFCNDFEFFGVIIKTEKGKIKLTDKGKELLNKIA